MISLKRKESGFTIVELLIVIVIIGILAALVIMTFSNTQKKARDADRKNDLTGISKQLEVYYADANQYPTLLQINDRAQNGFIETSMKDLKSDLTKAPGSADDATGDDLVASGAAISNYQYEVTNDAGTACDNVGTNLCSRYTLTATLENGDPVVITSANN